MPGTGISMIRVDMRAIIARHGANLGTVFSDAGTNVRSRSTRMQTGKYTRMQRAGGEVRGNESPGHDARTSVQGRFYYARDASLQRD